MQAQTLSPLLVAAGSQQSGLCLETAADSSLKGLAQALLGIGNAETILLKLPAASSQQPALP